MMKARLLSLACVFSAAILLGIAFSNPFNKINLPLDFGAATASSEQGEPPAKQAAKLQEVSVTVKQKKNVTLFAIKNNGQELIFGFEIHIIYGDVKFVKVRGWDRERIDPMTVLVKTTDRAITQGKSMVVLVITNRQNPSYEWSAFDKDNNGLAKGNLTVSEPSRPALSQLDFTVNEYQIPDNSSIPLTPVYDQNRKVIWINDATKPRAWTFVVETGEFKVYEHEGNSTSKLAIDGNERVWFVDNNAWSLGYIEPEKNSSRIFKLPVKGIEISAMILGSNDNVWIAVLDKDKIVSFNPNTEEFKVFDAPAKSGPSALLVDKSGMVWFSEAIGGKIGRLDPSTAKIVEYQPSDGKLAAPSSVIQDSNGYIWLGQYGGPVRFDPATLNFQRFSIPDKTVLMGGMVEDRYGNIWYAQPFSQYIAVFDPIIGETKEIPVPSADPQVQWLTIDGEGNVWFTEQNNAKIGIIKMSTTAQ